MIRRALTVLWISLLAGSAQAQQVCLSHPWATTIDSRAADAGLVDLARWLDPTFAMAPGMAGAVALIAPDLCLSEGLDGAIGYLDAERRQIVVDVRAAPALQRGILLHELRHLQQLVLGYCPSNALGVKDNARATFAMEADASAVSLLLAWQRRADGDPSAWDALAAWPQQADMAARFVREMAQGADLPTAAAAAFAQWYASEERRDQYYRASCSDYLDREDRDKLLRGSGHLPDDFIARLCILPDGRPYPCAEPALDWP